MKAFRHIFTVQGNTRFPVDMLRYDGCFPATSEDASALNASIDDDPQVRSVTLYKVWERDWQPTRGRWQSFGWTVDSHCREVVADLSLPNRFPVDFRTRSN